MSNRIVSEDEVYQVPQVPFTETFHPIFGFHAIRHLTASQLLKKGYSVGEIQTILRHKSASTTERYLKTLELEKVREALEDLTGKEAGRHINLRLIHLEESDGSNESLKKSRHTSRHPKSMQINEKGNQA